MDIPILHQGFNKPCARTQHVTSQERASTHVGGSWSLPVCTKPLIKGSSFDRLPGQHILLDPLRTTTLLI
jgi:hypothetical protein